jgi:predicted RNase H-like nuclease (RuvC/YqgF family)
MVVIQSAKWIADKIQDFVKRIGDLEDDGKETRDDVKHLKWELDQLKKQTERESGITAKIQDYQGQKIEQLEQRLASVERERHGARVSAGIAKSKPDKMKDGQKPRDGKRRH